MALLNFPSSPTNGQVYTSANGVSYQYNGTFWSAINTSYATGGFTKLDNISSVFNGSNTTFNLTASGVPVTPGTAQNLIITIGGVTQEPANAYTVSTSTITFTSAPPAGVTFSGVMLGAVMNVGVPSDSTVTSSKLDSNIAISANLSYGGTLTGSTGVVNIGSGQIYKDASGNVGIGSSTASGNKLIINGVTRSMQQGTRTSLAYQIDNTNGAPSWAQSNLIGHYYTGSQDAVSIRVPSSATANTGSYDIFGDGSHRWYLTGGSTSAGSSATSVMMLDTSGRLGIGVTSPGQAISVSAPSTAQALGIWNRTLDNVYGGIYFKTSDGATDQCIILNERAGTNGANLLFYTKPDGGSVTESARINASGNLLIGTVSVAMSSPKLDVSGSRSIDGVVQFENNVNTGDVNHGILNLINTATGAAGNDARIMFSFRQVGASTGLDPMASLGAVKESGSMAAAIQFNTRSGSSTYSEKMRLDSIGQLGIGTSNPLTSLHVNTQNNSSKAAAIFRSGNSSFIMLGKIINSYNNAVATNLISFGTGGNSGVMVKVVLRGASATGNIMWEDVGYAWWRWSGGSGYVGSGVSTVTTVSNVAGTHNVGVLSWSNPSTAPILKYTQGNNGYILESIDVYVTNRDNMEITMYPELASYG